MATLNAAAAMRSSAAVPSCFGAHSPTRLDLVVEATLAAQRLTWAMQKCVPVGEGQGLAFMALQPIAAAGRRGLPQVELARRLGRLPTAITRLVDSLQTAGLVVREPHPCDRRVKALFLTPLGHEVLTEINRLVDSTVLGGARDQDDHLARTVDNLTALAGALERLTRVQRHQQITRNE